MFCELGNKPVLIIDRLIILNYQFDLPVSELRSCRYRGFRPNVALDSDKRRHILLNCLTTTRQKESRWHWPLPAKHIQGVYKSSLV